MIIIHFPWYESHLTLLVLIFQIAVADDENLLQWDHYFIPCYGEVNLYSMESY